MCAALARRLPVVLATVVFAAVHVQVGVLLPPSGNELQSQHHKVCFVLNLVGGFFFVLFFVFIYICKARFIHEEESSG